MNTNSNIINESTGGRINWAKLCDKIVTAAVSEKNVNSAWEGNIYDVNFMECTQYPTVNVAAVRPAVELENMMRWNVTLTYIDRLQDESDQLYNPGRVIVESNGITALSNVIKSLREEPWVIDLPYGNQYTIYSKTQVFADICQAVSTDITVYTPKDNC